MTDDGAPEFNEWIRRARNEKGLKLTTGLGDPESDFNQAIRRAGRRGIIRTVGPVGERPPSAYEAWLARNIDPATGTLKHRY